MSPSLAAFVLSIVPPLAILAVIYGRYLRKLTKMTQDSLAEATQVILQQTLLVNFKVILMYLGYYF